METVTTAVLDQFTSLRDRKLLVVLGVTIFGYLGGLIFTTQVRIIVCFKLGENFFLLPCSWHLIISKIADIILIQRRMQIIFLLLKILNCSTFSDMKLDFSLKMNVVSNFLYSILVDMHTLIIPIYFFRLECIGFNLWTNMQLTGLFYLLQY